MSDIKTWTEIPSETDQPIQIVTVKFPLPIKQTDEKIVEMRVPLQRGKQLLRDRAIDDYAPGLSQDDHDLLVDMIEAYAQKMILRFSIKIS